MDQNPKSMAKSKRSHTLHGRKNHPPPAPLKKKKNKDTAQTEGETGDQERAHRGLPTNWNRYGDEDVDGDAVDSVKNDGEVMPKSKGADFRYLVQQAKENPQDFKYTASSSSFLDEISVDFIQGVSSMISERGRSILSWCEDDNFIVDEDSTSNYEVPILSMDLNALASQLSKVKLSQRLFIEPELLPEELDNSSTQQGTDVEQETPHVEHVTKFGEGTSEADIDMLLSSFNETVISEPVIDSLTGPTSTDIHSQPANKNHVSSRNLATTVALDDSIDDLLAETSLHTQVSKQAWSQKEEVTSASFFPHSLNSKPTSASTSTRFDGVSSLDDSLDDLLAETSSLEIRDTKQALPNRVASSTAPPPVDDFDSWLDSL